MTYVAIRLATTAAAGTAAVLMNALPGTSLPVVGPVHADSPASVEVVLVLDASRSVRYGGEGTNSSTLVEDVVTVAQDVLAGVTDGTNGAVRAAVVSYDDDARIQLPLTPVNPDSLAEGGVFDQALGEPGDGTGPLRPTTGYAEHSRRGQGSNWQAGLSSAMLVLDEARSNSVRLVVHITDGEPTAHLDGDGKPVLSDDPEKNLAPAAVLATELKDAGARVVAVGIGQARTRLAALVRTSGPDVYDQSRSGETFDPRAHDVILLANGEALKPIFAAMVTALTTPKPMQTVVPVHGAREDAENQSEDSWPNAFAGVPVVLLLVLLVAAALTRRRLHRQAFGAGSATRRRRRAMG